MKLISLRIQNFRSCRDVSLDVREMRALVGANNAGKSTVLRALDILFNPSARQLDEESFWGGDTSLKIRVEGLFAELRPHESEALAPYLRPEGNFHMARQASYSGNAAEGGDDDADERIKISAQYNKPLPKPIWLRENEIDADVIKEWLAAKGSLVIGEHSFAEFLGQEKPTVKLWKERAVQFAAQHLQPDDYEDVWIDNPKGYAGVLKHNLPLFVLIPAVRDVADESRVSKTNPFGRLVHAVVSAVTQEHRDDLDKAMSAVRNRLNREGGEARIAGVCDIENRLNTAMMIRPGFDGGSVSRNMGTWRGDRETWGDDRSTRPSFVRGRYGWRGGRTDRCRR